MENSGFSASNLNSMTPAFSASLLNLSSESSRWKVTGRHLPSLPNDLPARAHQVHQQVGAGERGLLHAAQLGIRV
jgi:hypothetical protein